ARAAARAHDEARRHHRTRHRLLRIARGARSQRRCAAHARAGPDHLPRRRCGGARLPLHRRGHVRGFRVEDAHRRAPRRPAQALPRAVEDSLRRGGETVRRLRSGLRSRGYRPAARPCAPRVPRPPPRAEPGALMGFLVPAFLAGFAAVVVPIVLHLRHRDKDTPHRFPSLMFVERLPIRTAQRRRITDWPLLLLRALAIVLLVLAFARPLWSRPGVTHASVSDRTVIV